MKWLRPVDDLLRGEATRVSKLTNGRIELPLRPIFIASTALMAFYGACMSTPTLLRLGQSPDGWLQLISSAIKLPLLFLLTLLVTLPSLYVFNALVGSRLALQGVLQLMLASLAVMGAVLASLGPIIVFFSLSTTSHPFMVLLNVVASAVAGVLGLTFLFRTLNRLVFVRESGSGSVPPAIDAGTPPPPPPVVDRPSALDKIAEAESEHARSVFKTWVVVFSLVGAQMSWVLRPFIGSPTLEFAWFRERESNFFIAVIDMLRSVLGGG